MVQIYTSDGKEITAEEIELSDEKMEYIQKILES